MNALVLAYIGDAYFELLVRDYLIKSGLAKVNQLQKASIDFSSARSQSKFLEKIKEHLTEQELDVVMRARNNKRSNHPKNTDLITYKHSTAFEALIGYLYLEKSFERIDYLFERIVSDVQIKN